MTTRSQRSDGVREEAPALAADLGAIASSPARAPRRVSAAGDFTSHEVRYLALCSRDRRFDGRFFVAVRTTKIYCRPICPAPTPKAKNVSFFTCAAAAEAAGYRPCLRCRPESAPGTPAWMGTSATVARALRLIDAGALDDGGVEQLAERLGIGDRHLRRLFLEHVGVTPVAVAHTRRVQLAKKLLDETTLPIARVALDAGFSSVRRFNEAMRGTYGRPPRMLRRERRAKAAPSSTSARASGAAAAPASSLVLRLAYRPPLAWDSMLSFLAARAIASVEQIEDGCYRRCVRIGDAADVVEVRHDAAACSLLVSVPIALSSGVARVLADVRRVFDLDADPAAIARVLGADPRLAARIRACPGLRVPVSWVPFECAVRAVVGQQVTVRGATTIMNRIVERYGEHAGDGPLGRLFPSPHTLAGASLENIGMPGARARGVVALARAVAEGDVALDGSRPNEDTLAALERIDGIGRWTSTCIAMRALGDPDTLPLGDLGLLRALADTDGKRPTARDLETDASRWRPWRAYAAVYLWSVESSPAQANGAATKLRKRASGARR